MSTSGGIPAGALSRASVHLGGAAIATLFSDPIELIPAPGAGKAVVVLDVAYETVAGVIGYDATTVALYYDGDAASGQELTEVAAQMTLFAGVAPTSELFGNPPAPGNVIAIADAEDRAVVVADLAADPVRIGAIVTATLQAGGAGYAIGDTGTISGKNYGATATYVVDTVAAITGAVLTFHVVVAGTGYDTLSNPHATIAAGSQPGVGTGFTLNITAIPPADGDLYVTAWYAIIPIH